MLFSIYISVYVLQFEMNVDNQDAPVMKLFEDEDSNVDSQNIFQVLFSLFKNSM
jgi:hypothetical protein